MPFLFLVAASLGIAAARAAGEAHYNASACRPSVPCGANVEIYYPFFLAGADMAIDADGYTAHSYCGYPGMAVACDGGRATLRFKDSNYTVLAIDYDKHTVTVADADALDGGGGGCPRVKHNVSVPVETWLNLSTTANVNLAFYFGCALTAATPPPPPIPPINCSGFPEPDGVSYVAAQDDVPPKEPWPRACKEVVVAPVLKDRLVSSEYLPRLNSDGYGKLLKQGFQLTWDPSAGPCFVCEGSGGQCSYNQRGEFTGCLCSDGGVRSTECGNKSGIDTCFFCFNFRFRGENFNQDSVVCLHPVELYSFFLNIKR